MRLGVRLGAGKQDRLGLVASRKRCKSLLDSWSDPSFHLPSSCPRPLVIIDSANSFRASRRTAVSG